MERRWKRSDVGEGGEMGTGVKSFQRVFKDYEAVIAVIQVNFFDF